MVPDSSRISPTAHYTSYVWVANGLSHPALATTRGRLLHAALAPANAAYARLGHANLDEMLLARHRVIDHLLEQAVVAGRVRQVVEIAAGMSPRGFRFAARHPGLRYIEADLPAQAALKRVLLERARLGSENHEVVALDALRESGNESLASLAERLERRAGTAIITEGLTGYFDRPTVEALWHRIASVLALLGGGVYLSDLVLHGDATLGSLAFRRILSWFARGEVHLHYDGPAQAEGALLAAGFASARAHRVSDFTEVDVPRRAGQVVRVLEAWIESPPDR
jgi:O-methyltransferase involved in polyketide biosynthesis